ncbi:Fic/DOC family protein [Microbacterium invictum]|uniref:protein adenylyltransferase n=1 Tax=Microbacterium invictum TaxID=515415 RepID=A0AA40VPD9_9MICO|nr:Fic family protein [Microbacterium invictum]MBB4141243.1 cell filamentation protein [Microbacterium invictum]
MASPDPVDPYLIPGTDVLRNRLGIVSTDELSAAEADLSFARALQLLEAPVAATNDLEELQRIHFHLFQDVYDWAGQIRTIDVRKDVPGAQFFLPHGYIGHAAAICFAELAEDNHLANLPRAAFVDKLACHYEKINYIHPFREGNGRVQRIYWNRVALAAGWQLDWRPVHGEENHTAARIGSDQQDLGPLATMFDKIVTTPDASSPVAWSTEEIRRLSISPPHK